MQVEAVVALLEAEHQDQVVLEAVVEEVPELVLLEQQILVVVEAAVAQTEALVAPVLLS
jgi:hypothetical protein